MSIFPAGYLDSHKDDADDSIDIMIGINSPLSQNSNSNGLLFRVEKRRLQIDSAADDSVLSDLFLSLVKTRFYISKLWQCLLVYLNQLTLT